MMSFVQKGSSGGSDGLIKGDSHLAVTLGRGIWPATAAPHRNYHDKSLRVGQVKPVVDAAQPRRSDPAGSGHEHQERARAH